MSAEPGPRQITGMQGLRWLARREALRIYKLWTQTVLASVISSILFIIVFGLSLGGRIKQIEGVDYAIFIVPGLIAMAMIQAAFSNNASTIYQARSDRYVNDVLYSPMKAWQMNLGFNVGGYARALAIGAALVALAVPLTGAPVREPLVLLVAVVLAVVLFGALGMVVGIYAESWDHTTFLANIVILPLAFLGGVFYSISSLPSPWQELSHFNPIFYLVNAFRYGFLGTSDANVWLCLGVTAALAIPLYLWSQYLFSSGRKLKA
jgi:ABC-2 type transport system permease protein